LQNLKSKSLQIRKRLILPQSQDQTKSEIENQVQNQNQNQNLETMASNQEACLVQIKVQTRVTLKAIPNQRVAAIQGVTKTSWVVESRKLVLL
jgi:hypothetical protein